MEGTQRAVGWMYGDHDRCFLTLVLEAFRQVFFNTNALVTKQVPINTNLSLEAFRQVFFNTNALPRITIGADVWGESDIMTGVY